MYFAYLLYTISSNIKIIAVPYGHGWFWRWINLPIIIKTDKKIEIIMTGEIQ